MKIYTKAYLDRNIGDDLMLRLAAQAMPHNTFHVPSSDPMLLYPFADLPNIVGSAPPLEGKVNLADYDGLLTIGGSMYILGSRKSVLFKCKSYKNIRRFKTEKKTIAVCGCNLGLASGRLANFVVNRELKLSDSITLRDSASGDILSAAGISAKIFPDMLFSIDIPPCNTRNGLGISVYRNVRNPSQNLAYYKTVARIADDYITSTGKPVYLFAFDCELENDLCAAHTIAGMMKSKQKPEIIAYTGEDHMAFLARIAMCEAFIATRFHSLVFALSSKTPVLPIIYSKKTEFLLDDIAYKGEKIAVEKLEQKIGEISKLTLSPEKLFVLQDSVLADIKQRSRGHIEALCSIFKN